jgi:Ala-tRNA(Pro) deacylase
MWDTKAKTNRKMWLICAAHDTNMNMKAVEKALGAGNGKLRGAGTDFMERILGVLPGAVNLFSILNDTANEINLVMDKRLMDDFELVAFHPMINTATTAFRREDIQKIIDASKHEV